jgi:hypothetical protein
MKVAQSADSGFQQVKMDTARLAAAAGFEPVLIGNMIARQHAKPPDRTISL